MIECRYSTINDVDYLESRLRESDVKEIWASCHNVSREALQSGLERSVYCMTIVKDGEPIGMFGVRGESVVGSVGIVWALGTDRIKEVPMTVLMRSRKYIDQMLSIYPMLTNFVHAENLVSLRWLKKLGATILEKKPFGCDSELFHQFYFVRS